MGSGRNRWIWVGIPLVLAAAPLVANDYWIGVLVSILIYTIAAQGLSLYMTYGGQVSLGHGAFLAVGGYTSAILTTRYQLPPAAALVGAVLVTAVLAVVVGLPILRLKGHYLAVGTLTFALLVVQVIEVWTRFTGGPSGIPGIPDFAFFGWVADSELKNFYLVLIAVLLLFWLTHNWVNSRVGRNLLAIHSNPAAALALGIPVNRYLHIIFVISALYAGLAGSLLAHYLRFISPAHFSLAVSVDLVIMVLVGGDGSVLGPLLGAALWTVIPEATRPWPDLRLIFTGLIVALLLLFFPHGVTGLFASAWRWFHDRKRNLGQSGVQNNMPAKG